MVAGRAESGGLPDGSADLDGLDDRYSAPPVSSSGVDVDEATVALTEPAARTAWDGPIVTAARPRVELPAALEATDAPSTHDAADADESAAAQSLGERASALLVGALIAAALVAGIQVAETEGWVDSVADPVVRAGALVSTWCAIVLLSRRCGGRTIVIGGFSAVVLVLAGAFPETWALAGGAVTAGTSFGLLAMVYTRPARGAGLARELAISASIGVVGALVVAGYDVELRPYRFRMMVLAIVLICAFARRLATRPRRSQHRPARRRDHHGRRRRAGWIAGLRPGRPILGLARRWCTISTTSKARCRDLLGAAPRPVEALVGFPALVWGVSSRRRRRQGWWMCAFGSLGAAGVTSSLIYPDTGFGSSHGIDRL